MTKRVLLLILGALFASATWSADKIYSYKDRNGITVFSSTPPADADGLTEIQVEEPNVIEPAERARQKAEYRAVTKRVQQTIDERKALDEEIAAARRVVARRKQALEAGRTPLPGERLGVSKSGAGGSRLTAAYYERVKKLEQAVVQAEEALQALESRE